MKNFFFSIFHFYIESFFKYYQYTLAQGHHTRWDIAATLLLRHPFWETLLLYSPCCCISEHARFCLSDTKRFTATWLGRGGLLQRQCKMNRQRGSTMWSHADMILSQCNMLRVVYVCLRFVACPQQHRWSCCSNNVAPCMVAFTHFWIWNKSFFFSFYGILWSIKIYLRTWSPVWAAFR